MIYPHQKHDQLQNTFARITVILNVMKVNNTSIANTEEIFLYKFIEAHLTFH